MQINILFLWRQGQLDFTIAPPGVYFVTFAGAALFGKPASHFFGNHSASHFLCPDIPHKANCQPFPLANYTKAFISVSISEPSFFWNVQKIALIAFVFDEGLTVAFTNDVNTIDFVNVNSNTGWGLSFPLTWYDMFLGIRNPGLALSCEQLYSVISGVCIFVLFCFKLDMWIKAALWAFEYQIFILICYWRLCTNCSAWRGRKLFEPQRLNHKFVIIT